MIAFDRKSLVVGLDKRSFVVCVCTDIACLESLQVQTTDTTGTVNHSTTVVLSTAVTRKLRRVKST